MDGYPALACGSGTRALFCRSTIQRGYSGASALAFSRAARSSWLRSSSAAAYVVRKLLRRFGAYDDAHDAFLMEQPSERHPRHRYAVPFGNETNGVDDVIGVLALNRGKIQARASRIVRASEIAAELAAQQATGQRTPHHQAKFLFCHQRNDLPLDVAAGDGVVSLDGFETRPALRRREAERFHDLPGHQIRTADIADMTGAHEVVERALFRRGASPSRRREFGRDRCSQYPAA
jgi:hypothetical protein